MISGIGLSGSDREESESNQLWASKEDVVSNSDVKKFGIPQFLKAVARGTDPYP